MLNNKANLHSKSLNYVHERLDRLESQVGKILDKLDKMSGRKVEKSELENAEQILDLTWSKVSKVWNESDCMR